jgi:hypothetical protein
MKTLMKQSMDELVTANKQSKQGCFLVVDDNMLILDTFDKRLSSCGYQGVKSR